MAISAKISFLVFFCVSTTLAQFQFNPFNPINPLLFGEDFGEFELGDFGETCLPLASYGLTNQINQRLQTLEAGIRTGAIGGCESGELNSFSSIQTSNTITFSGFSRPFLTAPSLTIGVSSLTQTNPALVLNFQLRATSVSATSATVTLTDANANIASATVSYLACPSRSSSSIQFTG